ncbi:MAG: hypothetical protein IJ656_02250 [Bacilli bacterium]|nr:hypothetical protein [Bacilli bacterium]
MSFKITVGDKEFFYDKKIKVIDLVKDDKSIICCRVNNKTRDLYYEIDSDSKIDFLTLNDRDAMLIYEASLRYLFCMAAYICYPDKKFFINYGVSRSLFVHLGHDSKIITSKMMDTIEKKMRELVKQDIPLERLIVSQQEALEIYKKFGMDDKSEILNYRPEKTVHFYKCGDYYNYMYNRMVASTGYLKDFKFRAYTPGMLLSYPRSEANGAIPEDIDEPIFAKALHTSRSWAQKVGFDRVFGINSSIKNKEAVETINLCENKHNRMLCELGDLIESKIDNIRLICIAGPSSSGKTTFSDRLVMELESRGIHPHRISIDDYYKPREEVPLGEDGKPDFESIDALDKAQFNEDIINLLDGQEVTLPIFDFKTNKRLPGKTLKIGDSDPLVIEGIHALSEKMTELIPKYLKFKIYIAPQAQINLDRENPVSLSDIRLLRRIVRDYQYRGASATETFSMWPNVRAGEFKWIYSTQNDADYVFDSFLCYEFCILKKYAMPLLQPIDINNPYYPDAQRLIKFLKYFKDIDDKWIPCNSILREFIGGSCYRDGKLS